MEARNYRGETVEETAARLRSSLECRVEGCTRSKIHSWQGGLMPVCGWHNFKQTLYVSVAFAYTDSRDFRQLTGMMMR